LLKLAVIGSIGAAGGERGNFQQEVDAMESVTIKAASRDSLDAHQWRLMQARELIRAVATKDSPPPHQEKEGNLKRRRNKKRGYSKNES
jgi:hypothetical protein